MHRIWSTCCQVKKERAWSSLWRLRPLIWSRITTHDSIIGSKLLISSTYIACGPQNVWHVRRPSPSYEQKAYEERWINEVLGNIDSSWTEQPNAKILWRKGIPPKFRAILWRQIVGNKLSVTTEFYNQLRSEDNVQEAIVSVHLEKNPIKLLLELKQKQEEEPKSEENPQVRWTLSVMLQRGTNFGKSADLRRSCSGNYR